MKRNNVNKAKRLLCMTTAAALLCTSLSIPANTKQADAAGNSYGISNPVISKWKSSTWTTWDCIYFGSYWQNDTNGDGKVDQNDEKQPIKWRVLSVDGDDAFLMADQGLDCQPYNEEKKDVTWETCTLRTWLNGTFFNNAFSSEEQNAVTTTSVVNNGNAAYGVEGGNTTEDKVFLLSIDEASNKAYGFSKAKKLWSNTAYVKTLSVWCGTYINFWLRSPGEANDRAAIFDGGVDSSGNTVYDDIAIAVCPVLHLDLSSSLWSTAGKTVSCPPAVRTNVKWLGKGKVKVTWKKMAGVAGYKVRYKESKSKKGAKTIKVSGKKNSIKLKGFKKKKTYFIWVSSYIYVGGKKYESVEAMTVYTKK